MSLVSVLPIAMAAVVLFVGLWHWLIYSRSTREREHLYFALLCLGIGLYDLGAAASYSEGALFPAELGQRLQNLALALASPALFWFARSYTHLGSRRVGWALVVYYLLHALALVLLWNDWVLAEPRRITTVHLPWGATIVYQELRHGVLLRISDAVHGLVIFYVLALAGRFLWNVTPAERPRARRLALAVGIFLLGALNDLAVTSELYSFVYLLEYSYLALVLLMTHGTSSAVLEVTRARSDLRRSLTRLQRIFENLDEVYVETTLDGRILEISPSARRWLGPDFAPHLVSSLDFYARPGERARLIAALRQHGRVRDFESEVHLPDGRVVTSAANLSLAVDEETGETRIVGSLRDITERKRAETERQRIEERMRQAQKLESLGVLAGGIAHDFNNLLTGIVGTTDLALVETSPDHGVHRRLAAVREIAARATELCRQMLAYSGRAQFDLAPLDLSALVHEMEDLLGLSVSKNVSLRFQLDPGLPAVVADPTQLRQIVLNLTINASEAIGEAAGTVSIATRLRHCPPDQLTSPYLAEPLPEGDYVELEVRDTGCGMDELTRGRLFDPFFTTKFSGRGLGLAAVLGIVRGHRGTIRVESRPAAGSLVRVLIPAASVRPEPASAVATDDAWRGSGVVLFVDDEASVREVGQEILEYLGFQVAAAGGGREALQQFRVSPADFVLAIVDLTMPDASGTDVVHELLAIRPRLPVLLASGFSEDEGLRTLEDSPTVGFLAKPFTIETLRAKLRAALGEAGLTPRAGS